VSIVPKTAVLQQNSRFAMLAAGQGKKLRSLPKNVQFSKKSLTFILGMM
jgi:hypothetical protein